MDPVELSSADSSPKTARVSTDVPEDTDSEKDRRLLWELDLHILPVLIVIYFFAFLDRINLGNVLILGIVEELNLTGPRDTNVALLIFFVPYILFEVPGNLILKKVASQRGSHYLHFSSGFVKSLTGLIVCRFFLGVFEAGLFPGFVYLMSMYYKRHEFQKRLATLFVSGMLAGAFGGVLTFALAKLDGVGGYSGWRIFIVEGLMSVVLSLFTKFLIVDWPSDAKFLPEKDRLLVTSRVKKDSGGLLYFCIDSSGYAATLFNPTILRQFGYDASQSQAISQIEPAIAGFSSCLDALSPTSGHTFTVPNTPIPQSQAHGTLLGQYWGVRCATLNHRLAHEQPGWAL
ncbi:hypothetical protein AJ79_02385 [Helicocarpus griseus UAMH5409]|uniref:Major facilitator superfamily (MFS) profile domain-containing protein n=1 Tax=Helicocarpus griseus UAMH5409 TaxID=1447875 RepID=A0A2B7Y2Q7_9EURO|nr:hypothetical protein AJ79_02385 [Helicocarpus griseus UAMH5409]